MTHARALAIALGHLSLSALAGCCFDSLMPSPPPTPLPPPSMPGTGTGPLLPGGPGVGSGAPISFGPGSSDPTIAQGFGGGPVLGSAIDPGCYVGHYPSQASHVLTLGAPLPYVRVMAYSPRSTDLTLLVRGPSGVVSCNDDSDGLNPTVELNGAMPGEYQIFVGTFSAPGPEPYELGVSTSSSVTSSTMHAVATSFVPSAPSGGVAADGAAIFERTGTAMVTSLSGSIPGVAIGTSCTFAQTRVAPTGGPGVVDCRWAITCGGVDLYGGSGPGGYQPCSDPAWSSATLAMDIHTTSNDTDPTLLFSGNVITIGDDASGPYGAMTVVLQVQTSTPPLP